VPNGVTIGNNISDSTNTVVTEDNVGNGYNKPVANAVVVATSGNKTTASTSANTTVEIID